jgi:hypothetical protein
VLEGVTSQLTYYLKADLTFECTDPSRDTDDGFDEFTNAVEAALADLCDVDDGIIDPDMTVTITERWASILIGIEADTASDAARLFSANLRTALHAAGCGTPDWPTFRATTQTKPAPVTAAA